jgi:hypothetical protein
MTRLLGSFCRRGVRRVVLVVAADGAVRPQDHRFFEGWNQIDGLPDLSVRRR